MSNTRPLIGLCDRCRTPVRNYGTIAISPVSGKSLTFCGHHTNVHKVRLTELRWLILEPTTVDLDQPAGPFEWLPPRDTEISRPADCGTDENEAPT